MALGSTKLEITGKMKAGKEIVWRVWCHRIASNVLVSLIEDKEYCHLPKLAFLFLRAFDFKDHPQKDRLPINM